MHSFEPYGNHSWLKATPMDSLEEASIGKHLSKPLVRHKLLQPLPQSSVSALGDGPVGFRCALDLPPPLPRSTGYDHVHADQVVVPSARQSRPGSAQQPRVGTWMSPPLAHVQFSSALQLRRPGEVAAAASPWSKPKELFVLPLQTQIAIRQLAGDCSAEKRELYEGMRLSAWINVPDEGDGSSAVLEPLAACCPDHTLAVEPVELLIERGSSASGCSGPSGPMRFGEGFRLRDVTTGFYLSHGEDCGSLRWVNLDKGDDAADHRNLRFVAHGSELGAPLLFGRPVIVQRLPAPAPVEDNDDSDSSEYDSSDSESDDSERLLRRRERANQKTLGPQARASASSQAASSLVVDCGALLSRHADDGATFSAAFLPIQQKECLGGQGEAAAVSREGSVAAARSTSRGTSGSEEEEVRAMDMILSELKTELHRETAIEEEQRLELEQTARRMAELEQQIDAGDKLRRVAKEARSTRKVRNDGR